MVVVQKDMESLSLVDTPPAETATSSSKGRKKKKGAAAEAVQTVGETDLNTKDLDSIMLELEGGDSSSKGSKNKGGAATTSGGAENAVQAGVAGVGAPPMIASAVSSSSSSRTVKKMGMTGGKSYIVQIRTREEAGKSKVTESYSSVSGKSALLTSFHLPTAMLSSPNSDATMHLWLTKVKRRGSATSGGHKALLEPSWPPLQMVRTDRYRKGPGHLA